MKKKQRLNVVLLNIVTDHNSLPLIISVTKEYDIWLGLKNLKIKLTLLAELVTALGVSLIWKM